MCGLGNLQFKRETEPFMALKFFNSLTRHLDEFLPIKPGTVRLYTCGPTVYNFAHIGNFRAYMFEDLLRRTLKYSGLKVRQVMNLTDVDDKTIRGARTTGVPLNEFTQTFKDAFFADLRALRIERAEEYPAATDHIPEMISLISVLLEKNIAYVADAGSVYFSIARFPDYGKLARVQQDRLQAGTRVKHDEYAKESVADFALWKAWDEDDGHVWWESPWGKGRPGWHIECSAMSMKYLGKTFDIHTGGIDNMFPHHEDEIAQSEAANGCRFVNYWLHCAHLMVEGEKMSKSAGNFYTLRDILDKGYCGRDVRWVLLGTHYRQPLNFTFQGCRDAQAALQRIDDFAYRLRQFSRSPEAGLEEVQRRLEDAEKSFRAALEDDLNISAALAALFDLVRDINKMGDANAVGGGAAGSVLQLLRQFDTVLGCLDVDKEEEVPQTVLALIEERQQARKSKNFGRADEIRDALKAQGWIIEDTPTGPHAKRV